MELANFQKFLSNIEPTANQKTDASNGHTTLRERLEKDAGYKGYFLDSFISGSYGRDTAIRPISDVDVIIVTNHNESWKPDLVLYVLEKALSNYYGGKITRQGRSIRVSLSYTTIDVVPSIKTQGAYGYLKIPDRDVQTWVLTHPRKHIELATVMNASKNDLYKPLVKALKQWRDNRMEDSWKPKSFLLECLVYDFGLNYQIESIPKAMNQFFAFTHNKYDTHMKTETISPVVLDPAGTHNDVAKKWTYTEFCQFMDEVMKSWNICYQALVSQDYNSSVQGWWQLLGDVFPLSP